MKPAPQATNKQLIADITGLYATVGAVVSSFDPYTGVLLMKESEKRATELVNVARHHKGMMAFLKNMTKSNDYVALAIGHGLMLYGILVHYKQVPELPLLAAMGLSEEAVLAGVPGLTEEQVSQNGHQTGQPIPAYA